MPENYIAMFTALNQTKANSIISAAHRPLEIAADRIAKGQPLSPVGITARGRLKSGLVNSVFYRFIVKDKDFYSTDSCIGCGKCADNCVLGNITMQHGRPHWNGNCTRCMACICRCPVSAIEYGRTSSGKIRYQCPQYHQ